ncbi:FxLYD domain-containing protein [Streptomyces sp. NPDC089919]|uniref:FxLYD domain-containing protein n=1 Tax=Streptomyces sp. NPDC089919 TaxID=3155188 RepID=UPI00343F71B8
MPNPHPPSDDRPPGWTPRPPGQPPDSGPPWPPGPGWGPPPPPPPRRRRTLVVVLAVIGGLAVLFVVALIALFAVVGDDDPAPAKTPSGRPQDTVPGPRGDVQITSCKVNGSTDWAEADLLITNRSSKTSNYWVQVEFVDASNTRLGDATTVVNDLASGQRAKATAQGFDQITAKITCRITDVTRFAS